MQEDGMTTLHEWTFNFFSIAVKNTWFQILTESIRTFYGRLQ